MLPETWRLEMLAASGCCPHAKRPRRGMITDILVWADCYASMAAILSSAYPEKAPHLLAHFRTVVRAARNFEGVAWATYDAVCRRQAANRGSLEHALQRGLHRPSPCCAPLQLLSGRHTCLPRVLLRAGASLGQSASRMGRNLRLEESSKPPHSAYPRSTQTGGYPGHLPPIQCKYVPLPALQIRTHL